MKPPVKFENAMEQLDEIVSALEDGTLSLDEALKRYEEGIKLARFCTQQLTEAEKKIEMLTKTMSGELKAVAFDLSEGGEGASDKPAPKKSAAKASPRARTQSDGDEDEKGLF